MTPRAKTGLVVAGYLLAFCVAWAAVAVNTALTNTPDRQTQGGMSAFGDLLLFLAAFGVAAIPATGAALFFLRQNRTFWRVLSIAAIAIALTALGALLAYFAGRGAAVSSLMGGLAALAVLRILVAPLLALFFLIGAVLAPLGGFRLALAAATAAEAFAFGCVSLAWFYESMLR
jgi:hypothetical protein